jgi:hypothetical protein
MSIDSQMREAELKIRAWTVPGTAPARMSEGLLDAYFSGSEEEREAFVAALIGRLLVQNARTFIIQACAIANSERASVYGASKPSCANA